VKKIASGLEGILKIMNSFYLEYPITGHIVYKSALSVGKAFTNDIGRNNWLQQEVKLSS
jgi:hypothetical protein